MPIFIYAWEKYKCEIAHNRSMRSWTPYEKTQLARAGLSHLVHVVMGQTPVEYLTGQADFCGWQVLVSPAVLIPRVETEDLVAHCFAEVQRLSEQQKRLTIVEVGTGSGAIGLSLWRNLAQKQLMSHCDITLSDVSAAALEVAEKNLSQVEAAFGSAFLPKLQQMDLLSDWPSTKRIDLLIANLPYIPSERIASLDASVVQHEPRLALDGGADGLVLIKKLLQQAESLLSPNGVIWLEVDSDHTLEQFLSFNLPFQYQTVLDCFEQSRFIRATRAT